jgi:hypothetical protein
MADKGGWVNFRAEETYGSVSDYPASEEIELSTPATLAYEQTLEPRGSGVLGAGNSRSIAIRKGATDSIVVKADWDLLGRLFWGLFGAKSTGATTADSLYDNYFWWLGGLGHPSFSVNNYAEGIQFLTPGTVITGCTLGFDDGGTLMATFTTVSQNQERYDAPSAEYDDPGYNPIKPSHVTSLAVLGTTLVDASTEEVHGLSIEFTKNVTNTYPLGRTGRGKPRALSLSVTAQFQVHWTDVLYEAAGPGGVLQQWYADGDGVLDLTMGNGGVDGAARELRLRGNRAKLTGNPPTQSEAGASPATIAVTFEDAAFTTGQLGSLVGNTSPVIGRSPIAMRLSSIENGATWDTE